MPLKCHSQWYHIPGNHWKGLNSTFTSLAQLGKPPSGSGRKPPEISPPGSAETLLPSYLYDLITLQPHHSTRYSDVVALDRPPLYSSLKVNNRSFHHASPRLWKKLPEELRKPLDDESLSLSSHISLTGSSSSPSLSPLSLCITLSLFHSSLNYIFHKSIPPQSPSPFWIDLRFL